MKGLSIKVLASNGWSRKGLAMKPLAVILSVLTFAVGTISSSSEAEAHRRGFGIGAGIVAAAVIGGIIASAHRSRAYARPYYGHSYYGYGPSYYRPSYAYAAPVYRSYRPVYYAPRPVYYSRPVYRVRYVNRGWGHRGWGHRGWGHRGWGHRRWR
jgi:hypothetical protein